MTERVDALVVGAGVVGLAIARQLALDGREVLVLERNPGIGQETSSRNSEVIHAGLYYPKDTLKARLCVSGKHLLYEFCEARGIQYRRCGKLIVASEPGQQSRLEIIRQQGIANGVKDLAIITRSQLRELEPAVNGESALLSPSTGIIDSHGFMLALQGELESRGGSVVCRTPVTGGVIRGSNIRISVQSDGTPIELEAGVLVNAAGLGACEFAGAIKGFPREMVPALQYAKGNYFSYQGANPFHHLVYPLPVQAGLGVHATMDLGGQLRFGPDVEWVSEINYSVPAARAAPFYRAIRSYWPDLPDNSLAPAYSGIRPKLCGPGEPATDFCIQGPSEHGIPKLVNLFGIESPGLTAALSIARYVADLLR